MSGIGTSKNILDERLIGWIKLNDWIFLCHTVPDEVQHNWHFWSWVGARFKIWDDGVDVQCCSSRLLEGHPTWTRKCPLFAVVFRPFTYRFASSLEYIYLDLQETLKTSFILLNNSVKFAWDSFVCFRISSLMLLAFIKFR